MPTGAAPVGSGSPQLKTDCPADRSAMRAGHGWLRDTVLLDDCENDTATERHGVAASLFTSCFVNCSLPCNKSLRRSSSLSHSSCRCPSAWRYRTRLNALSSCSPRQPSHRVSSFRSFAILTSPTLNFSSEPLDEMTLRRTPIFILGERFTRRKRQNHLGEPIRMNERKIKDPNRESLDGCFDRQVPGTFTQCTEEWSRECSVMSLLDLAAEVLP